MQKTIALSGRIRRLRQVFGSTGSHPLNFDAVFLRIQPDGVASLYGRTGVTLRQIF
jgi:hypothetical protein